MCNNQSSCNSTGPVWYGYFVINPYVLSVMLVTVCIGFVINVLLLIAHKKDPLKCFENPTSCLIHYLALVDASTLFGFAGMLIIAYVSHTPIFFDSVYIEYLKPSTVSVTSLGCFLLTSLAIERLIAVGFPLFYQVHITKEKMKLWLCVMLSAALLLAAGDFVVRREAGDGFMFLSERIVATSSTVAVFALYLASVMCIKRQQREFQGSVHMAELERRSLQAKLLSEKRFLATIFVMNLLTMVAWVPALLVLSFKAKIRAAFSVENYHLVMAVCPFCLASLSILNPFLYIWRLPKYRKTFRKLYCSF